MGLCSPTEVQCGSHASREEGRSLREHGVYPMFPQPVCSVRIPYRQRTGRDRRGQHQMCGPLLYRVLKRNMFQFNRRKLQVTFNEKVQLR